MNFKSTLVTSLGFLLFCIKIITGDHHAKCPTDPIQAVRGNTVTLQCRLDPQENVVDSTVDWKRADLDEVVHSYRHNRDHHLPQAERFRGRTALNLDDLSRGIYTLNISSVQPADSGSYRCFFSDWTVSCNIILRVVERDQKDESKRDSTSTRPPLDNVSKLDNSDGENRRDHVVVIIIVLSVVLFVCLLIGLGCKYKLIGNCVQRFRGRQEQQPEMASNGSNLLETIV